MARVHVGDARTVLRALPAASVQTCVTSPPYYGLRDYGVEGQLGHEQTPEEFVSSLVAVFRAVRRVLRDDGTLWINLGDTYARAPAKGGSGTGGKNRAAYGDAYTSVRRAPIPRNVKPKDLIGIPWMVAFALRSDGWYLRQDIIWHKPNQMPEPVKDRCTKAHEYVFLLSKSERYAFDADAVREPTVGNAAGTTRNRRSVWSVNTQPFKGAHFATFPAALVEPCILAGSRVGDTVLDPFSGAATTGVAALRHGRHYVGIELNDAYARLSWDRLRNA